jgi:RNA polymerase sigma-70 factor, ECF subfamily
MHSQQNTYNLNPFENSTLFEKLIKENEEKIINLIHGMTGDYHVAQDLTQEAFLKAYQSKQSFNGKSKFSTWLYRIAVNTAIDYQRKQGVRLEHPSEEISSKPTDSDQDPDDKCQKHAIKKILFTNIARLPNEQRDVFMLREINGFSTKEVADILNISNDLVKWRLHKARNSLRKLLNDGNLYENIGIFKLGATGIE